MFQPGLAFKSLTLSKTPQQRGRKEDSTSQCRSSFFLSGWAQTQPRCSSSLWPCSECQGRRAPWTWWSSRAQTWCLSRPGQTHWQSWSCSCHSWSCPPGTCTPVVGTALKMCVAWHSELAGETCGFAIFQFLKYCSAWRGRMLFRNFGSQISGHQ